MKTYNIACIPGDGIGKEVVPAGEVASTLAHELKQPLSPVELAHRMGRLAFY